MTDIWLIDIMIWLTIMTINIVYPLHFVNPLLFNSFGFYACERSDYLESFFLIVEDPTVVYHYFCPFYFNYGKLFTH